MKEKIKSTKIYNNLHVIIFALIFACIGAYVLINSLAATTPRVYLNPASSSVDPATEFSVDIMQDSGSEVVNGVTVKLSYDATKLDVVSIDKSSSDYKLFIPSNPVGASGKITFSAAAFDDADDGTGTGTPKGPYPLSGIKKIATIKFKSKTTAGSANVSFETGTQLNKAVPDDPSTPDVDETSTVNILGSLDNAIGGNYTINSNEPPAAQNTIKLAPATQSIKVNTEFTVQIMQDSGTTVVNGTTVKLTYDATKLDVVSIDKSSSAYKLFIPSNPVGASGNITFSAAAFDDADDGTGTGTPKGPYPVSGEVIIATIRFKSKTTAGAADVKFVAGTQLNKPVPDDPSTPDVDETSTVNILGSLDNAIGGTYTITGSTPTPRSGGGTDPSPSPTPPPSNTPTPKPSPSPSSSAGGTSTKPKNNSTGNSSGNSGSSSQSSAVAVNNENPTTSAPIDEDSGNSNIDEDLDTIQGYPVTIKVVTTKGKAKAGFKVTLDGSTKITDKNGIVKFDDVLPGTQKIVIDGKSYSIKVNANISATEVAQEITVKINEDIPVWQYVAGAAAVASIIGVAVFVTIQNSRGGPKIKPPQNGLGEEAKAVVMTK